MASRPERKLENVKAKAETEAEANRSPSLPVGLVSAACLVVVLWGMGAARPLLLPLSLAALLAFMMTPMVRWLRRAHLPELVSVALAALLLLLPFAASVYALVQQGQALLSDLPSIMGSLNEAFEKFSTGPIGTRLGLQHTRMPEVLQRLTSGAGRGIALLVGGLSALLNASSQIVVVFLFTIMMVVSRCHLRRSFEALLGRVRGISAPVLLDDVAALIERFLIARFLIVLIIGGLAVAELKIMGLNYAILLGSLVGLLTLVPAIGFVVSLVPVIIVSLATGSSIGRTALTVGLLLVLNIADNYLLTPRLVGGSLNLNALTTFVALFAGGLLWGIWGMLLSVPLLGALRIVLSTVPELRPWGDLLSDQRPPRKRA